MHTNYRRRRIRDLNFKRHRGRWGIRSKKEYQRIYWSKNRAKIRNLIEKERYDDIIDLYFETIVWDWF